MTTTTVPSPTPRTAPGGPGRLTIDDRAVERIAAHAVVEVDGVGGAATRMLGVAVGGENPGNAAKVAADVRGDEVSLDVRLSVAYPASVRRTADHARDHLMRKVESFTGLTVSRVDITVTALHPEATETRRVQ